MKPHLTLSSRGKHSTSLAPLSPSLYSPLSLLSLSLSSPNPLWHRPSLSTTSEPRSLSCVLNQRQAPSSLQAPRCPSVQSDRTTPLAGAITTRHEAPASPPPVPPPQLLLSPTPPLLALHKRGCVVTLKCYSRHDPDAAMFASMENPYDSKMTKGEKCKIWDRWSTKRKLMHILAPRFPSLLHLFYHRSFLSGKQGQPESWLSLSLGKKDLKLPFWKARTA